MKEEGTFQGARFSGIALALGLLAVVPQMADGQTTVYLHDFGTNTITEHPYIVAPGTFDANLSNSSWTNSKAAWTSYAGSSGQAIALSNSSNVVITLSFDVASGYEFSLTAFNFWRMRSTTGAQNWDMAVNGIAVGSGTVPTTGAFIGQTNVANTVTGLTGTVKVNMSLTGASGAGTFRLDDFQLIGSVTSTSGNTPPVISYNPAGTNQSATVGNLLTVTVTATDPEGDDIILTDVSLPPGASFDGALGASPVSTNFTWTPSSTGTFTAAFAAEDEYGAAVTSQIQIVVTEPAGPPSAPASIWASATNSTDFTAAWSSVSGATSYRLDVSLYPAFVTTGTLLDEDFDGSTALPAGWTDWGTANNTDHESSYPNCRALSAVGGQTRLITPRVNYPTQLVFFAESSEQGAGYTTTNYYSLDGGSSWSPIGTFTVNMTGVTNIQALTSAPNLSGSTGVMFRFVSAFSTWYVDDVKVNGVAEGKPSFIAGYSNRTVSGTSQSVTGLTVDTTYYFRARAVNGEGTSGNSTTTTVTTLNAGWTLSPFTAVGAYVSQKQSLTFPGSTNEKYTLEYKAEISDTTWTAILTGVPGTNTTMTLMDTNARDRVYYRVKAELYP